MIHNLSRPHAAVALLDEPDVVRSVTCPMCHTRASLAQSELDAGAAWRCSRCGQQQWDAARLTTVAADAVWVADRDRADRRSNERSREAAPYRNPPTERVDGTP